MIGVPDEKWGETVKALVVVREGETVTARRSSSRTAATAWPTSRRRASVEFRDALDRTATGKLQKYKLRQPYWSGRDAGVN